MTTPTEISLTCQLTVRDLYLFSLVSLRRKFWWFLMLMATLALYLLYNLVTGSVSWNIQLIAAVTFFFLFLPYSFFVAPYLSARKRVGNDPRTQKPISYTFSDTAIQVHSSAGDATLNWTAFTDAFETRSLFALYPQQMVAYVLPKRSFPNDSDIRSFRELVRSKVSKTSLAKA
jgi:YcxB-like protein